MTAFRWILSMALLTISFTNLSAQTTTNPYFEILEYQGVPVDSMNALDTYLEKALLPALHRQGIQNVGVFRSKAETEGAVSFFVLLPLQRPQSLAELLASLQRDTEFHQAGQEYFLTDPKKPIYQRMRSELLVGFDCMPNIAVPKQKKENKDRLFELRTYESATERMGARKVEMFNSGEVPIFLDCGIQPVFFGQAIIGDKLPNLTYMTVYDNEEQMNECWKKFRDHPEWKKLSQQEKYQGTVSKIHKTLLLPRPYSQL